MGKHVRRYAHRTESSNENKGREHEAWALYKLGIAHVGKGTHRAEGATK